MTPGDCPGAGVWCANGIGGPPTAAVAAQAAAAKTFCTNNNGAAPAGFFLVGDGPVIGPKQ